MDIRMSLWAGAALLSLIAQPNIVSAAPTVRPGQSFELIDIPCAGRVVLRNDASRDEWADVRSPAETRRVRLRGRRSVLSYVSTTLFLGSPGDTITISWRGQSIVRVAPRESCYIVPREPRDQYPTDQGVPTGSLSLDVAEGEPIPGLLLVGFRPEATYEERSALIASIGAQVVGGIPGTAPLYWLLVPDDSLATCVRAYLKKLRRSPLVRKVEFEMTWPGAEGGEREKRYLPDIRSKAGLLR